MITSQRGTVYVPIINNYHHIIRVIYWDKKKKSIYQKNQNNFLETKSVTEDQQINMIRIIQFPD